MLIFLLFWGPNIFFQVNVFFDYLCCKSKGAKKMRQNVQHLLIFTVVFVQLPKDVSFKATVNQEGSMHFHWSARQISQYWGFLKLNCFAGGK